MGRCSFSTAAVNILKSEFEESDELSDLRMQKISQRIQEVGELVTTKQVRIWFQNRRQRYNGGGPKARQPTMEQWQPAQWMQSNKPFAKLDILQDGKQIPTQAPAQAPEPKMDVGTDGDDWTPPHSAAAFPPPPAPGGGGGSSSSYVPPPVVWRNGPTGQLMQSERGKPGRTKASWMNMKSWETPVVFDMGPNAPSVPAGYGLPPPPQAAPAVAGFNVSAQALEARDAALPASAPPPAGASASHFPAAENGGAASGGAAAGSSACPSASAPYWRLEDVSSGASGCGSYPRAPGSHPFVSLQLQTPVAPPVAPQAGAPASSEHAAMAGLLELATGGPWLSDASCSLPMETERVAGMPQPLSLCQSVVANGALATAKAAAKALDRPLEYLEHEAGAKRARAV